MKILFINGSPRKNGYTVQLMKMIEATLSHEHEVQWLHADDLAMKSCQSCLRCRPGETCKLPRDDGHIAWKKIREAEALILGSPTYFGNVSGPLKTLIDRSLTAFETISASGTEMPQPLHRGQKAIMVTACNAPQPFCRLPNQSAGTLQAMETVLNAGGYQIIGSLVFDGAAAKGSIEEDLQREAQSLGKALNER